MLPHRSVSEVRVIYVLTYITKLAELLSAECCTERTISVVRHSLTDTINVHSSTANSGTEKSKSSSKSKSNSKQGISVVLYSPRLYSYPLPQIQVELNQIYSPQNTV